jgi:hypothetical protein
MPTAGSSDDRKAGWRLAKTTEDVLSFNRSRGADLSDRRGVCPCTPRRLAPRPRIVALMIPRMAALRAAPPLPAQSPVE